MFFHAFLPLGREVGDAAAGQVQVCSFSLFVGVSAGYSTSTDSKVMRF
jgi:hypothetical protein